MIARISTQQAILGVVLGLASSQLESAEPPDLTKGVKMKGTVTWSFGPTGAYGWFWSEGLDTDGVRQAYVTKVDPGSPAANVLQMDDVVIGVVSPRDPTPDGKLSGPLFAYDVRKELAAAIAEAEKSEHGGKLVLNVWRKGRTLQASLSLPTMGAWSRTAPSDCQKTDKVIERAADHLLKSGIENGIAGHFDALGLLATGDKKYLAAVQKYAHEVGKPEVEQTRGMNAWHWGFANLFLTEYYLATGDEYVLPAIKEYTTRIATGQSAIGTWGHGLAVPITDENGTRPGIIGGYGAINQTGLVCSISLVLGRKCGVKSPVVDRAIDKAAAFFRFYADKGGVPYGDHPPRMNYSANGKTAAAAVLFDLLGEPEPSTFFAKMAVASYDEIEGGHTGNYWSLIWGPLGAACGGDAAAAAYSEQIRWYTELERRWTGNMVYQGQLTNDPNRYRNWSASGVRLLHLCLPRQKIYLTGRGGRAAPPLSGREVAAAVAVGNLGSGHDKSPAELLALLRSWSPVVRRAAGEALGQKGDDVVKILVSMLDENDRNARYGACEGLRAAGRNSVDAVEALISKGLKSDDPSLRYHAINSLTSEKKKKGQEDRGLSGAAHKALSPLLDLAISQAPTDPLQTYVAEALGSICKDGKSLENVDRSRLIAAIRSLLKMSNGGGRSQVAETFYSKLTPEDLRLLWGDIYLATAEQAPSGEMFSDAVRISGVKLMAHHGVQEGIKVGAELVSDDSWGAFHRIPGGVPAMSEYGDAMREYLPMMKEMVEQRYGKEKDQKTREKLLGILEKAVHTKAPELISIKPQIEQSRQRQKSP